MPKWERLPLSNAITADKKCRSAEKAKTRHQWKGCNSQMPLRLIKNAAVPLRLRRAVNGGRLPLSIAITADKNTAVTLWLRRPVREIRRGGLRLGQSRGDGLRLGRSRGDGLRSGQSRGNGLRPSRSRGDGLRLGWSRGNGLRPSRHVIFCHLPRVRNLPVACLCGCC